MKSQLWFANMKRIEDGGTAHRDEGSHVRHKTRVLLQPLVQVSPPGRVVASQSRAVLQVDDGDSAFQVHWGLPIPQSGGHDWAGVGATTPTRGHLGVGQTRTRYEVSCATTQLATQIHVTHGKTYTEAIINMTFINVTLSMTHLGSYR